jgi:hypothetical protein
MLLVLIIVCLLLAFGGLPQVSGQWHSYGYGPSGIIGVVLIVCLVLFLMGRL